MKLPYLETEDRHQLSMQVERPKSFSFSTDQKSREKELERYVHLTVPLEWGKGFWSSNSHGSIAPRIDSLISLCSLADSFMYDILDMVLRVKTKPTLPEDALKITAEDVARALILDVSLYNRLVAKNPKSCRLLQLKKDPSLNVSSKKNKKSMSDISEGQPGTQETRERPPRRRTNEIARQRLKDKSLDPTMNKQDDDDDDGDYEESDEDEDEDDEEEDEEEEYENEDEDEDEGQETNTRTTGKKAAKENQK